MSQVILTNANPASVKGLKGGKITHADKKKKKIAVLVKKGDELVHVTFDSADGDVTALVGKGIATAKLTKGALTLTFEAAGQTGSSRCGVVERL